MLYVSTRSVGGATSEFRVVRLGEKGANWATFRMCDEMCKRSASFLAACFCSDNNLVKSVVK